MNCPECGCEIELHAKSKKTAEEVEEDVAEQPQKKEAPRKRGRHSKMPVFKKDEEE